jgi:hypothetical protein
VLVASVALLPRPAAAQSTFLEARSLLERFAGPGLPGQVDDLHMGSGLPRTWMGHVAGALAYRDELFPRSEPWPGLDEVAAPIAWYDSVSVVFGEDAGWRGFGAALVELRTHARPSRLGRPRAAFTLMSGSSGLDRAGLTIQRGSQASWLRGGALSEERAGTGLLDPHGQHAWFAESGLRRGAHEWSGAFAQRGLAGGTRADASEVDLSGGTRPPFVGFEEAARGEAGALRWRWTRGLREVRAELARSHDHRESFEPVLVDLFAEREAQRTSAELEVSWQAPPDGVSIPARRALRLACEQDRVLRTVDFLAGMPERVARRRAVWAAASERRPFAGGELEAQLGAGYDDTPDRRGERAQVAPSLTWGREEGGRRWRVHAGRIVTPIWSDLAPAVSAFMQDIWAAGASLAAGSRERAWLETGVLATETGNRARLPRWPVRDVSLRLGWTREDVRVQDVQGSLALGGRLGPLGADGSFYSRLRPAGSTFAQVDPARGARAGLEARFRVFAGDLGVRLRAEAAWVGERDTEPLPGLPTPPRPLPAYATYAASVALTLGDASIVVRAENLEGRARPQIWSDPSRGFPGAAAVGAGREVRLELAWPFYN